MKLIIKNTYKCKDGRWRAYCVDENNKAHIISYPRILVEEKLGRPLKPDEDIHHIDGNPDNNDINNLEVIMHGEHQREHSTKYFNTVEMCIICGTAFIMEGYAYIIPSDKLFQENDDGQYARTPQKIRRLHETVRAGHLQQYLPFRGARRQRAVSESALPFEDQRRPGPGRHVRLVRRDRG